jgi:titin
MSTTRTATANWATPPSAPTIGTATAGNGQVQLTWTANSNGGSPITSYTVTPYINGVAQPSLAQTFQVSSGICTGTACGATITTVQNGTTYTFTVYATNVVGNSPESGQSNAVTPTVGLCVGAASASLALCGFSLTSGFSPIKLTGQDITGNFASVSSFSVQDQQTTGSGWNVTVQASPLSCTAGIDSGCRQNDNLGGGLLSMAGPLSVGTGGSSCVSGCSSGTLTLPQGSTPFFIDNGAVKIASYAKTSGDASYTFAPGSIDGVSGHNVGLTVPAHAYATTYHTTITLTVATGP